MPKSLRLQATLDASKARSSLKGLITDIGKAEKSFSKLQNSFSKGIGVGLKSSEESAKSIEKTFSKFADSANSSTDSIKRMRQEFARLERDNSKSLKNSFTGSKFLGENKIVGGAQTKTIVDLAKVLNNTDVFTEKLGVSTFKTGSIFTKNFIPALKATGSQMQSLLKWGGAFAGITSAFAVRSVFQGMYSFSKEFGLMNATLKAQLPETKKMLRNNILDISSLTGATAEDVTQGLTQIFSADIKPKSPEGTEKYKKELEDAINIQKMITKTAIGTGTSTADMAGAGIAAMNAFGKSTMSVNDWPDVLGKFAGNLDTGVGLMKEYTNQYGKFAKDSKNAGFTATEATSIFARLTKTMTTERAGMASQTFFREMSEPVQNIPQAKNTIKRAIETLNLSPEELRNLQPYSIMDKWMEIQFTKDDKGNHIARSGKERLQKLHDILKQFPSTTLTGQTLLKAMFPNSRAALGGQDILSVMGFEDLFKEGGILSQTKGAIGAKTYLKKFEEVSASFAGSWDRVTESMRNEVLKSTAVMEPAFNLLFDTIGSKFSNTGNVLDMAGIQEVFASVRKEAETTAPRLLPFVNIIEKLLYAVEDGTIGRQLAAIGSMIKFLGNVASFATSTITALSNGLNSFTFGNGLLAAGFGAMLTGNLVKTAATPLSVKIGKEIFSSVKSSGLGTLIATQIGNPVMWAGIATLIGLGMAKSFFDSKAVEDANKYKESAKNITALKDTFKNSPDDINAGDALAATLSKRSSEKYNLAGMSKDLEASIMEKAGISAWDTHNLGTVAPGEMLDKFGLEKSKAIAQVLAEAQGTSAQDDKVRAIGQEMQAIFSAYGLFGSYANSDRMSFANPMSPETTLMSLAGQANSQEPLMSKLDSTLMSVAEAVARFSGSSLQIGVNINGTPIESLGAVTTTFSQNNTGPSGSGRQPIYFSPAY